MVIQHNIAANNAYRNLSMNATGSQKNLEKLSDDAAGLAISEQMRSKINGLDQATQNAQDGIGLIQTAEGALTETHNMLQRLVTLSTQAANGTYNTTARSSIKEEVEELKKEITRIADTTDYNGVKPIATGATKPITLQIGPTSGEILTVAVSELNASKLGISGIVVTSVSKANTAITKLNAAIDQVSKHRAKLGAAQNRLEHTINNLKVTSENMTSAESRIRDTDMAKEIAAFTKNNILNQAAQSMLAQANQQPQGVLSLLR